MTTMRHRTHQVDMRYYRHHEMHQQPYAMACRCQG